MSIHLVITFMGKDQPGLVESVASVVAREGGNWLESRMSHLGGQFAGVLRVAIEEAKEASLLKSLLQLQESGLSITVRSELAASDQVKRSLVTLELLGSDQVGIVSQISGLLASLDVNVEELHTELTTAPMSAELLFKARGLLQLPASLAPETLRDELEAVAADLMVDLQLQREI
ncbi:MAG: ACT domain-containing protein [Opitutales bacterium]|jgi:glycine cleavage system regulatory protein|nr:glycine cleavage system protein R [bacterium]MDG2168798.1 ACT domain-containing protein [Opitutales bacterium]